MIEFQFTETTIEFNGKSIDDQFAANNINFNQLVIKNVNSSS